MIEGMEQLSEPKTEMIKTLDGVHVAYFSQTITTARFSVADEGAGTIYVVMVHGNGFCKELWLPIIEESIRRLREPTCKLWAGTSSVEFIALDLPCHGDSESIPFPLYWWKFGSAVFGAIHNRQQRLSRTRPGFRKHKNDRLIGVGHSMGGTALLMAQLISPVFDKLLVIEPMIFPPPAYKSTSNQPLVERTQNRRNAFESRDAARQYFTTRSFYRTWERRTMEAYLQYGLKETKQEDGKVVLRLKCDPAAEAELFRVGSFHNLHDYLNEIDIPIRLLHGNKSTYVALAPLVLPRFVQVTSTFREIDGATHALPMERPELVAEELVQMLAPELNKAKL